MKKVMFIMAAALLMLTQCKKENETPTDPAEGTVKMTVTAGPGRTSIDIDNGAITWSEGDKLYVSDGSTWLGSLTLERGAGSANGTFTGDIASSGEGQNTCHFFYLGHDNGMTGPTAGTGTGAVISFAEQDGTLAGAMKYHIGYGKTSVTVTEGEATGNVRMDTKIAIARINFTTDGTTAYTGSLTMGGTGIYNTMTVSPNGTFSGSGNGGIVIGGTTGERYVTLIPATGVVSANFTGDAIGSMTFLAGIHENKFYGMKDAVKVTVTEQPSYLPGEFSVSGTTKVKFSKGNLYWNGSAFRFEANQWSFKGTWDENHVSHFFWSKDARVGYAADYDGANSLYGITPTTGDVFFTNGTQITANPNFQVNGETGTWRTLSDAEWGYLLGTATPCRDKASSLRAWKDLGNNVKGLVILPDGTDASVMSSISSTEALATYGAVFLPATGHRDNYRAVYNAGWRGNYWSSTPYGDSEGFAYKMDFDSGIAIPDNVITGYFIRNTGYAVRLVR